jgi:hypothetical protein
MREESFCQFWSFLSFSFTQICLQLLQDHQIKWGLKIWSKVLLCHSVILLIPSVQEFQRFCQVQSFLAFSYTQKCLQLLQVCQIK